MLLAAHGLLGEVDQGPQKGDHLGSKKGYKSVIGGVFHFAQTTGWFGGEVHPEREAMLLEQSFLTLPLFCLHNFLDGYPFSSKTDVKFNCLLSALL